MGAIGRNGVAAPASMPPTPWTPIYGGYPLGGQSISGAQNLSGWSKFPPGHFVVADFVFLASPGPGKARSLHRSSSPTQTRYAGLCVGGRLRRPVGRKISNGAVPQLCLGLPNQRARSVFAVGAAHLGRPRFPAPTLGGSQGELPRRSKGGGWVMGSFLPGQKGTHPSNTILTVK